MPTPDFDNLASFLDLDAFAIPAILRSNDQEKEIVGILDLMPLDASIGASDFDALPARFTSRSADLKNVKRGDLLIIDEDIYTLRAAAKHDGTGIAVVELTPGDGDLRGGYV